VLLQFTFSNFRAFRETQTLSLAASNSDETLLDNCFQNSLPGLKQDRWVAAAAIYGPNASGKTSVIEALRALGGMITKSAKITDPEDTISRVQPFALDDTGKVEPGAFSVVFVADNIRYEYRVAATTKRVIHESLRAFRTSRAQIWFQRDFDEDTKAYKWTPESPVGYKRDQKKEEFTLPNVLYLSKAISLGDKQLEPVYRWFKHQLRFLDLSNKSSNLSPDFTARYFTEESDLAPKIIELLRQADLGIAGVEVHKEKMPVSAADIFERIKDLFPDDTQLKVGGSDDDGEILRINLKHDSATDEPVALAWNSESAGTHRLFALAGPWLDILENGYTVCIDELETSMHPIMVTALLELIFNRKTNPNGAQVIFTTHNPLLLDSTLLRRDQVWFVDKDNKGSSHLYPLTDYSPRKNESLVRGYLAGRYGAVPFIPRGLLGTFLGFESLNTGKGGKDE